MKTKTITRTGLYDHWQREIVKDVSGTHFVLVDDVPHHTTKMGEPTFPLCDFVFRDMGKSPPFDSNDYPGGFDPTLYDLENGKVLNTKKQKGLTL